MLIDKVFVSAGGKKHEQQAALGTYLQDQSTNAGELVSRTRATVALVQHAGVATAASIIDVGGGASTLVDDLLNAGFPHVSVLDISAKAL